MISTITWNIPRETLFAIKGSTEEVGDMLRMTSAVKLYEMGRISSGIAARLACMPVVRHWIITAYLTRRLANGEIEWHKN
jgi:hypothetical protein